MKTICVMGLGYIGLPTAAFLSKGGMKVYGVDINEKRVEQINDGLAPFSEPGFGELLEEVVKSGQLVALQRPVRASAFVLAVPTPVADDHEIDMTFLETAVQDIAPLLEPGNLVILESTCPPGTTRRIANLLRTMRPDLDSDENRIHFAHAPERVLPGKIMNEMVRNSRIIGGLSRHAAELTKELYSSFCSGDIRITDAETAEMTKLAENAFRDINIAYANELSMICDKVGVDVWELISLANLHPRVNILSPGPGVGGHCIAIDPWFLVGAEPAHANLIRTAREVNDSKPEFLVEKIEEHVDGVSDVIALFGLSFKANIEDLRESPSLLVLDLLRERFPSNRILVIEPNIQELPEPYAREPLIELTSTESAISHGDILVFLVAHEQFLNVDFESIRDKKIVDAKGVFIRK